MSALILRSATKADLYLSDYQTRALFQVAFCSTERGPAQAMFYTHGCCVDVGASRLRHRDAVTEVRGKVWRSKLTGPLDDIEYWRDLINDHMGPTVP
jgi:hypothetical protein